MLFVVFLNLHDKIKAIFLLLIQFPLFYFFQFLIEFQKLLKRKINILILILLLDFENKLMTFSFAEMLHIVGNIISNKLIKSMFSVTLLKQLLNRVEIFTKTFFEDLWDFVTFRCFCKVFFVIEQQFLSLKAFIIKFSSYRL